MYIPEWLLDGTGILLPGWLFLAQSGTFVDLPMKQYYTPATEGRVVAADIDPARDARFTLYGQAGPGEWVSLPGTTGPANWSFAWVDNSIYVHRVNEETGEATCYQIRGAQITSPECLVGGMITLSGLRAAPGGKIIVSSYGEGHPAVDLVTWTGGASEPVPMPWQDLYPFGPVQMFPRADGSFDIHTPCVLGPPRPCEGPEGGDTSDLPMRHYRWTPGQEPLLLTTGSKALRPQDPTSDRSAWVKGGKLCLGGSQGRTCVKGPKPPR
jgi:hypothetical protein